MSHAIASQKAISPVIHWPWNPKSSPHFGLAHQSDKATPHKVFSSSSSFLFFSSLHPTPYSPPPISNLTGAIFRWQIDEENAVMMAGSGGRIRRKIRRKLVSDRWMKFNRIDFFRNRKFLKNFGEGCYKRNCNK